MKKKIIVAIIATALGIALGINSDMIKAPVEKVYCSLLPNECAGEK